SSLLSKLIPFQKAQNHLLYEFLDIKKNYYSLSLHTDIKRLLFLIPNNPEPILGHIIRKALDHSKFWEENDKKLVQKSLETLYTIWGNFGETAHLLVALSMLSSDKTIRSVAAEIWIKGVNEGTIDSSLLGEIIGK